MKYTNKPTKQILAKLKNRYKQKGKDSKQVDQNKPITLGDKEEDVLVRRNTGSSLSGLGEDVLMNDNTDRMSKNDNDTDK